LENLLVSAQLVLVAARLASLQAAVPLVCLLAAQQVCLLALLLVLQLVCLQAFQQLACLLAFQQVPCCLLPACCHCWGQVCQQTYHPVLAPALAALVLLVRVWVLLLAVWQEGTGVTGVLGVHWVEPP
jgi:hypothetical protein